MKRYVFTDLHGCYDLYKQIKEFVNEDDVLYCLGDCGDRGPQSWETLKAVLEDPQVIYLKGNHDDMLGYALFEQLGVKPHKYSEYRTDATYLCKRNGGGNTLEGVKADPAYFNADFATRLINLPTKVEFDNECGCHVVLTHAGFTPALDYVPDDFDLIWSRDHFFEKPSKECINWVMVHGHTPTEYLVDELNLFRAFNDQPLFDKEVAKRPVWYCDDHKVDLDIGAVWYGSCALMDLDTFEEFIFTRKDMNEDA